jgi:SulP family sulfate permease
VGAGIIIAVLLTVLSLLLRVSRPHDAILGRIRGGEEFGDIEQHPDAVQVVGLLIYRFDTSLLFFNADYFKQRVRAAVAAAPAKPRSFILDVEAVTMIDITAAYALEETRAELESRGIGFTIACSRTALREQLDRYGLVRVKAESFYPSIRGAVEAFEAGQQPDEQL